MSGSRSSDSSTDFSAEGCDLDSFRQLVETTTEWANYHEASGIVEGAVVYEAPHLASISHDEARLAALRRELAAALADGPGIVLITGAVEPDVVDQASAVFDQLIAEQRAAGRSGGDHFAAAGANDRVWNSLEKLALRNPDAFVAYHDNLTIDLVATAWLGPAYQVTAQVNVVNPGGAAQAPHRDYHLGFLSDDQAARYPRHVHLLSPALTLQGAVAHGPMPVESGPTMFLPHSQKYEPGYLAWRRPDFQAYFEANRSQPPLNKGDVAFFNPALFHGAGTNHTSDRHRMANLLQISSAFGRAMEQIDRRAMVEALYPALVRAKDAGRSVDGLARVIAASAEGYPFPADLDRNQPVDGMAPESMASIVSAALEVGAEPAQLREQLDRRFGRRRP